MRMRILVLSAALAVLANPAWPQPAEQPAAAAQERTLVGVPIMVAAKDLPAVLERVNALIAPATLEELAAPSPQAGISMGSGVAVGTQTRTREDGMKVTVMSAQKGEDSPPTNVGVWHDATEGGGGGLAALFGGNAGKLVLRLHDPSADADAEPFGFRRVRLFKDGVEEEYTAEDGHWMLRTYHGAGL